MYGLTGQKIHHFSEKFVSRCSLVALVVRWLESLEGEETSCAVW